MLKTLQYQEDAVAEMLTKTFRIISNGISQTKLLLKAPTGSGKTVMMGEYLKKLIEELPLRDEISQKEFAFIWIAPNQLHEQSYEKMKEFFSETRTLQPISFEDISDDQLKVNQIVFFNWQSITGDNRIFMRDNEHGKSLPNFIDNSRLNGVEIITILDEAHLFASKGKKANVLLNLLQSTIEIDVSATPFFHSDYTVMIERKDVVKEGMIKKGLILNPALESARQDNEFRIYLVNQALEKRRELSERNKAQGNDINPLLLIQLPNDKPGETQDENKIIDLVKAHLSAIHSIHTDNGRLAVWLSKETANLDGLENANNPAEVLLFKQAIALGWDCPRAAVLLIFREYNQASFGIQTVGRILRMPEQKHYDDEVLNYGYVFTNLSKSMITIENEIMYDVVLNKSFRKKEYQNISLLANHINLKPFRKRLKSSFYRIFKNTLEGYWALTDQPVPDGKSFYNRTRLKERFIETNVDQMDFSILTNTEFEGRYGEVIRSKGQETFILYAREVEEMYVQFCFRLCGDYAKVDTAPIIRRALIEYLFEEYLEIDESRAMKIVLLHQKAFIDLLNAAYQNYQQEIEKAKHGFSQEVENREWEVPEIIVFNEKYKDWENEKSIMEPLYLYDRGAGKLADSENEFNFIQILETAQSQSKIKWWYKNGTEGKEHFSINYVNHKGRQSLFFVDFVIQFNSGKIGLFDPKTMDSQIENVPKHNALVQYVQERSKGGKLTAGSIVIPDKGSWWFCENLIDNDFDLKGWKVFNLIDF